MEAIVHDPASRLYRGGLFSTLCSGNAAPQFRRLERFGGAVTSVPLGPGPLWPAYLVGPLHGIGVASPPKEDVIVTVTPPYSAPFNFVVPSNAGTAWHRHFRPALEGSITVQFSTPGGVIEIVHGQES